MSDTDPYGFGPPPLSREERIRQQNESARRNPMNQLTGSIDQIIRGIAAAMSGGGTPPQPGQMEDLRRRAMLEPSVRATEESGMEGMPSYGRESPIQMLMRGLSGGAQSGGGAVEGDIVNIDKGSQQHDYPGPAKAFMQGLTGGGGDEETATEEAAPSEEPDDTGGEDTGGDSAPATPPNPTPRPQDQFSEMAKPGPNGEAYTVKKGDTLWALAKKYYGDGTLWPMIAYANNIKLPKNLTDRSAVIIQPGQKIIFPKDFAS